MELYQLRSFATIAELGQLTRAAEKLHVSQPALSAQLKALEDELDLALFRRTANGMVLTTQGRRLLAEAEKILAAAQAFKNQAALLKGQVAGQAGIGTLSDPELTRIGEFTSLAMERYPSLQLELHQCVTGYALEQVRDGAWDAGFYYGDMKYPTVAGLALRKLVFRVAVPAAWKDRIATAGWPEIAALPWIIPPPLSSHHQMANALFAHHGVEPARVVEADQEAVIASLVVSGVGIALMREDIAREKEAAGEICLWRDEKIETTLWFIHSRAREADPVIRALIDVQKDVWRLRRETVSVPRSHGASISTPQ
jgi:DNA-binding transcriptional LysR family regulator